MGMALNSNHFYDVNYFTITPALNEMIYLKVQFFYDILHQQLHSNRE